MTRRWKSSPHCRLVCRAVLLSAFLQASSEAAPPRETSNATEPVASQQGATERFDITLRRLQGPGQSIESRQSALARLDATKRTLDAQALDQLRIAASDIAKTELEPPALAAQAIRLMASVTLLMQEQGQLTPLRVSQDARFVISIAADEERDLLLRGSALYAIDLLSLSNATQVLEALADDPGNMNLPAIARPLCLALLRLKANGAIDQILPIIEGTQNASVFKTSAYCLGQIKTTASMVALVRQGPRFPNAGVQGLYLVDMEDAVLDLLRAPGSPAVAEAVEATRYLWREGQRERYVPLLHDLVRVAEPHVRRASVERLIDMATVLPPAMRQAELRTLLATLKGQLGLQFYAERIKLLLSLVPLAPTQSVREVPNDHVSAIQAASYGNTISQEYGDAIYHRFAPIDWIEGTNYNHAGIYAGLDLGHAARVLHAQSTGVEHGYFDPEFVDLGADYYGAYTLTTEVLSFSDRKEIVRLAALLEAGPIGYPALANDALEWRGSTFDGSVTDILNIRCDGVVEYCYEKRGKKVWWNTTKPLAEWNISRWPDVQWHNDMPGLTVDPHRELSPWAQRGAPSETGPPFDQSDNPYNTNLTIGATISFPTYDLSTSQVGSTVYVNVTACDESGIHYIKYTIDDGTTWHSSPTQPQHPDSSCYTFADIPIFDPTWFCYYAKDNGGNSPEYADCVWVDVEYCGNGNCSNDEDCDSCPGDCGPCCGNGFCGDAGENCETCSTDCGPCCPNGFCDFGETCNTCPGDCGPCCGNGFCGDSGENCQTCSTDCGPCCSNGFCDFGETCNTCPGDCGPCCGNGFCGDPGENCETCSTDCGPCCPNGFCDFGETCNTCPGDCGPCPPDCRNGTCEAGEDSCNCPEDCGSSCGDACCNGSEDACTCSLDCPPVCGDGCCNGGETCSDCELDCGPCPPDCPDGICDADEDSCNCPQDCGAPPGTEGPGPSCSDRLDNDCDGLVDCDDPDCGCTEPCLLFDMNGDDHPSPGGDVEPFVRVVYFDDYPWYEQHFPGMDPICRGDCNCDGHLSIGGDVECFVDCVYFQTCGDCGRSSLAPDRLPEPNGEEHYLVGGAVYADPANRLLSGIPSVQVELVGCDGTVATYATTTVGPTGAWSIENVLTGSYKVIVHSTDGSVGDRKGALEITVNAENMRVNESICIQLSFDRLERRGRASAKVR